MAVLAMGLEGTVDSTVNINRCVQMALVVAFKIYCGINYFVHNFQVHDIGEAIVGDITPRCGVSDKQKFELEEEVINFILYFKVDISYIV